MTADLNPPQTDTHTAGESDEDLDSTARNLAAFSPNALTPSAQFQLTPDLRRRIRLRRMTQIMLVRVLLFTLILGGTVAVNMAWGTPEELGGPYVTILFVFIAGMFLLNLIYVALLRLLEKLALLAGIQVAVDLLMSAVLVHFTGGADSPYVIFFLLSPVTASLILSRQAAISTALTGILLFSLVVLLGYARWLPILPGQIQLPWEVSPGLLGRSLLINGSAIIAVALLSGYLVQQLRSASEKMEVQQHFIEDLSALNDDIIRCFTSGLITIDNQGTLLSINQAAIELLGLTDQQAIGSSLAELVPEMADAISEEREIHRADLVIHRGERRFIIGLSCSRLTDHLNKLRGWIINFRDLTSYRQMEEKIQKNEHLASLGRMAAGIAHEIRNPLASISGSLELLSSAQQLTLEESKLMEIALREIERLNGLITDFLNYARPKNPAFTPMDLGQEIHLLIRAIDGLITGEETPEVVVSESGKDLWIKGDHDQLSGVLWNLIRNAWEAGERERIEVKVLEQGEDTVALTITDHADGIPQAAMDRIFEPFFSTKERGTGLGLAMVHRMVQAHEGTIDVQSSEGQGTTFTIQLPRIPGKNSAAPNPGQPAPHPGQRR